MHGERLSESGKWTSYSVEPVQREAVGTFVAPFEEVMVGIGKIVGLNP
jgi:hypothetical protein